jgi:hypothetical protein
MVEHRGHEGAEVRIAPEAMPRDPGDPGVVQDSLAGSLVACAAEPVLATKLV